MNVRSVCLAILGFGEASGYEIRKLLTEGAFSHVVEASYGAIYPALQRLEADGLVEAREERREAGRPPARIYRLTAAGKRQLVAALAEPPGADTFRSPFMLVAMSAEHVAPGTMKTAIDERIEWLEAQRGIILRSFELSDHPATRWVCEYGLAWADADLQFLRNNRARLEALAGRPVGHTPDEVPAWTAFAAAEGV
jgi:DNA-binding PadR family transcriptional regulator